MPRIFALALTALTTLRLYGGPPPMLVAPRLNATQAILSSPAIIILQGTTLQPGLTDIYTQRNPVNVNINMNTGPSTLLIGFSLPAIHSFLMYVQCGLNCFNINILLLLNK
jgi:hypothetical protein